VIKLSLSFKGKLLKIYQPKQKQVLIGRGAECDIAIDNLGFANVHAIINIDGNGANIEYKAKKSDNSDVELFELKVNAKKCDKHELKHLDVIQLGKYILKFTCELDQDIAPAESAFPKAKIPLQGWLQIMSGPKLGRTIKLENPMVRLGKTGKACAMISNREGKYYISHLEGQPRTRVKNEEVSDARICLNDGDTLVVGDTQMLFFIE